MSGNILQNARQFVQCLVKFAFVSPQRCPNCGSTAIKKNGTYTRKLRDFGGVKKIKVQRYWCHHCRKSFHKADQRQFTPFSRYARRVQRKTLDIYFHLGGSLRKVAEFIRGELCPGEGRSVVWEPWCRRRKRRKEPPPRLSHTTVWRWIQREGRKVREEEKGLWGGVIGFRGVLSADSTGIKVKNWSQVVHVIVEDVSGVIMSLSRLREEEKNKRIIQEFRELFRRWGLKLKEVILLISDGEEIYRQVLNLVLCGVYQQRCLFHIWRNVGGEIKRYESEEGEEKGGEFRRKLKEALNAGSWRESRIKIRELMKEYKSRRNLHSMLRKVERVLFELFGYKLCRERGRPPDRVRRTTAMAESIFSKLKDRVKRMKCFMSERGSDNFLALWQVYYNFEPTQVRRERKRVYRGGGKSPLERGGAQVEGVSWLDAVGV